MGGGPNPPEQEELLITLPIERPESRVAELQRRLPHVKVTWVNVGKKEGREEELRGLWKTATILVTLALLPESVEEAPRIKLIHLFSAGVDHLATAPLYLNSSIPFTTSSGIHGPPITEWLLAALLCLTRHTFLSHDLQLQHKWGTSSSPSSSSSSSLLRSGTDWAGKTVGIAGYGEIGRQVARALTGLGVKVHVYTAGARRTEESRRDEGYIVGQEKGKEWGLGDREGALPRAWFSSESASEGDREGDGKAGLHAFLRSGLSALVVALPLTKKTEGLFGRREFEMLRDGVKEVTRQEGGDEADVEAAGCYFVNIARGKIVDQEALIEALNDGTLKGAALDVTEPEPLPEDSNLWDAKNCFVSPHVSGLGREYTGRALDVLMENLRRLEAGEKLVNEVRRSRGY